MEHVMKPELSRALRTLRLPVFCHAARSPGGVGGQRGLDV